ncbi:MAG TPA: substrate-binding domain-containing protein [Pseudolabrys sp.]|nr:substrate-binding domain-containing protein [Pseudolabrys sp.]
MTTIRVLSGGAPQEVLAVLTPDFEKNTGNSFTFTFAVITALRERLAAGEDADLALLPVPVIDELIKAGQLRAEGRATLGRVRLTAIVKEGAAKPDISSAESFKATLLNARSLVHATPGQTPSGGHLAKVLEQLGIAEAMRPKTIHRPALAGGVELVAKGEAEIGIYPTSEVITVKGVTVVGPIPDALQLNTIYGAAVIAKAASPEVAAAYIAFLADPANRKHWTHGGFD